MNAYTHLDATAMGNYVAELQLHLALQVRNLVPNRAQNASNNPCNQLLHDAQAAQEIAFSRLR